MSGTAGGSGGGRDAGEGMVYVILAYGAFLLAAFAAAAYYWFVAKRRQRSSAEDVGDKNLAASADVDEALSTNSIGPQDIKYIASKLNPDSSHMDILLAVASSPESIAFGTRAYLRTQKLRKDRLEEEKREEEEKSRKESRSKNSAGGNSHMFDLDEDGWADDDDDEDLDEEAKRKAKLAKETEEQKKKDREQLKQATGKAKIPLEGVDEGVIGQVWVEKILSEIGAWPPPELSFLKEMTFEYEGKRVPALDHPGLRRNLCNIQGRINSMALNNHRELRTF
jgi:hypothetical protein